MIVMLVCGVLAVGGVVAVAAWQALDVVAPPLSDRGGRVARAVARYLWWADLTVMAGLVAGLVAAGAGGRLVMRLLAVTTPAAQGARTEAERTVGHITVSGTLAFVMFSALPFALIAAVAFASVCRWLPGGHLAGLLFGLLLLIVLSSRIDPLRAGNPDFKLLGPGWLAVVAFGLVVVGAGMLIAAFAGWYSRRLPLPGRGWSASRHYLLTVVVLMMVFIIGVPVLVLTAAGAGLVALVAAVAPGVGRWWTSRMVTRVGRVLLAAGSLAALPGFLTAVSEILP